MKNAMTTTIIVGLFLILYFGCTAVPNRKISDHFNGEKFFNPTLAEQFSPGLSDIYEMAKEGRPKWPKEVENVGIACMDEKLGPSDISLTFINHATFLLQTANLTILTDPVWSDRASPIKWFGPKRVRKPGVAMEELPKIDVILISHNHYDHLDIETLRKLGERFSPKVFVPIGDKALIESSGIRDVVELDWWESVEVNGNTCITFTPAQHSSARGLFDKDESLWGSYFIDQGGRSVYFGGDGGYSSHFAEVKRRLGPPEFAILGIGAYAPRSFMKAIHMDPAEAVTAHQDLGATLSIGMHYGTFQLASEGFDQPQEDLKIAIEKEGVSQDCFITLLEGETKIFRGQGDCP